MTIKKYKYYFSKPKSEIVKDVFFWLFVAGGATIAATSPYFLVNIVDGYKKRKNYPKKKIYDTFYNLRRQGDIRIERRNHQIYISLTERGKIKAGMFQIDNFKIKKPKKWDKKWRVVIFDIPQLKRIYREALRGKLKDLGFIQLQMSVWVSPFDCRAEVELLRDFFGLSEKEMRLIIANNIGGDRELKNIFKLR